MCLHSCGSAALQCILPLNVAFITILHISLCLFCSEQTDAQSLSIDQQESTYRELAISVAADLDSPTHAQAVAVIIEHSITSERFDSPIRLVIKQSATIDPFMQSRLRYDVDQNLLLTLDEWSKMLVNPVAADINEDGKITLEEFVDWFARRKINLMRLSP